MQKTIIILTGNSRGSEVAWESLNKNVMKPLNADLALVFGKGEARNILYDRASYTKLVDEYDDWGDCIDMIAKKTGLGAFDWRTSFLKNDVINGGLWGGIKHKGKVLSGSGAIGFCFRWFVKELIEENNLLEKYDRFIITRSDHYHAFEHPSLENDHIWIPNGEEYGGICDRHIVIDKSNVIKSLEILPWCLKKRETQRKNPETVLKKFFIDIGIFSNIKTFDRTFFTVKTKTDQNRWGKGNIQYIPDLGLYSKYYNEYKMTMKIK